MIFVEIAEIAANIFRIPCLLVLLAIICVNIYIYTSLYTYTFVYMYVYINIAYSVHKDKLLLKTNQI